MSAHTPTPWALCGSNEHWIDIKPAREKRRISLSIATVAKCTVDAEANAEFIVRACNNFEALLAAAEEVYAGLMARLDAADRRAVPVFAGIAELHDAIHASRAEASS